MESQKNFLIIGLVLLSFMIWQQWQVDYNTPQAPAEATTNVANPSQSVQSNSQGGTSDVPTSDLHPTPVLDNASSFITIETDVISAKISLNGGDVTELKLLAYPTEKDGDTPYSLFKPVSAILYQAQSGLSGVDTRAGRAVYQADKENFVMQGDELKVPMTHITASGLQVTKVFTFKAGSYTVDVDYLINNQSATVLSTQMWAQLKQSTSVRGGSMMMPTYRGAAYSANDDTYEKIDLDEFTDKKLNESTQAGWVAMIEHYFVSAWVPNQQDNNQIYSRDSGNGSYALIGFKGPQIDVLPGSVETLSAKLYAGPKDQDALRNLADYLDLSVDYGMLWFISQPLFDLLKIFYGLVGNWGVAIILITLAVKGAMFWLTKKQYTSMAKLRQLQPKMQELKSRYGEDRQKMSMAMMELYKKEKVNPMGGCLPMLIQMPIFLALYWVFVESVELRHADFALWINDLSQQDPYYILPILMGASMFLMQKLQPTPMTDPVQQKIFQYMPVMFTVFFLWFPAGLVLYWLVSNLISIAQMLVINRSIEKQGLGVKK
ncbi:membrane protein insertase YidC [Saccharobesus litoralis]|uniref:Membrane protein insertase YidC n=1 Tax=Saccharobesus litoralis TaxID=2172099 RepID=A0A2S0VQC3_9ALTE|nr:membrane protein insertase YidC [Saccharobesus litoralis]AWB66382.1 membrane protein insertase YidC [Saccharobesus litoralis]